MQQDLCHRFAVDPKDDQLHFCSYHQHGTPDGHVLYTQNIFPTLRSSSIRCQTAEFYSATVRSSDRFCGHFVSGVHRSSPSHQLMPTMTTEGCTEKGGK